jgi:N-hydroxyarylamine O-acetyltransferase
MSTLIDLDAYFRRIGYDGERSPTLATLRALHLQHALAIAYENLNPLLRWPVRLDLPSLEHKLLRDGRGGYCYEHNLLFLAVLRAIGFRVTGLAARVLWNRPENVVTPRTHMVLLVHIDGAPYIADVGFGGQTLTGPLRLEPGVEQVTPHEPYRLAAVGDEFALQARIRGEWRSLCRFDLQPQAAPDYELANWYVSTHPESHFVTTLMAARPTADRRYVLRDNELTVHHASGATERRTFTRTVELRRVLEHELQIRLPDTPHLEPTLQRVVASPGKVSDSLRRSQTVQEAAEPGVVNYG